MRLRSCERPCKNNIQLDAILLNNSDLTYKYFSGRLRGNCKGVTLRSCCLQHFKTLQVMAQPEASDVTASCGGDAGGTMPVREAYSSVAGNECVTASASISSSCEYVTVGMSEEEVSAAIEKSRQQGWSELKDGAQDSATASCQADSQLLWEELERRDPRVVQDTFGLTLGRLIAEGQIYEAKLEGDDERDMVAQVYNWKAFLLADLQRQ